MLQAVNVHYKQQHPPARPAPKLQLAFCQGHEAATVIQACQFVGERKIAQFCLQHVLFRGAADRTHQKFTELLIPSATGQCAVGLRADISQQTREFSICFGKETLEKVINVFILSAW
jgi:hypothetical protein